MYRMKKCKECEVLLEESSKNFHKNRVYKGKQYYSTLCIDCRREKQKNRNRSGVKNNSGNLYCGVFFNKTGKYFKVGITKKSSMYKRLNLDPLIYTRVSDVDCWYFGPSDVKSELRVLDFCNELLGDPVRGREYFDAEAAIENKEQILNYILTKGY